MTAISSHSQAPFKAGQFLPSGAVFTAALGRSQPPVFRLDQMELGILAGVHRRKPPMTFLGSAFVLALAIFIMSTPLMAKHTDDAGRFCAHAVALVY
jgi:hypothetical protein